MVQLCRRLQPAFGKAQARLAKRTIAITDQPRVEIGQKLNPVAPGQVDPLRWHGQPEKRIGALPVLGAAPPGRNTFGHRIQAQRVGHVLGKITQTDHISIKKGRAPAGFGALPGQGRTGQQFVAMRVRFAPLPLGLVKLQQFDLTGIEHLPRQGQDVIRLALGHHGKKPRLFGAIHP